MASTERISETSGHHKLLALASHDMRDPISSLKLLIGAMLEELRSGCGGNANKPLVSLLDRMMRQTHELTWLVGCLEDMSCLETRFSDSAAEVADLTEMVSAAIERADSAARMANCKVLPHSSGAVVGRWHRVLLEDAILHIIHSSLRSGASKTIAVRVGADERNAWVSVEHHGPKVTQSDGRAVFDQELLLSTAGTIAKALGASLTVERKPHEAAALKLKIPRLLEGELSQDAKIESSDVV